MRYFLYFLLLLTASVQADPIWTTEAMMETKSISGIEISPDKQSILFVVTEQETKGNTGHFIPRIFQSDLNGLTIPFSSESVASFSPRWSPDGQWIAFLSNRTQTNQLYLIRANGGEAKQLTQGQRNIGAFAWSPDGQKIAFAMEDETQQEKNRDKQSLTVVYDDKSTLCRLWLLHPFEQELSPKPLTTDEYCVRGKADFGLLNQEFDWSPDSQKIIFAHSPKLTLDSFYFESSLAEIDLITNQITPWEKTAHYESTPRYSPNGQWVAYLCSDCDKHYALNHQVAIRTKEGNEMQLLAQTPNGGPFLVGPNLLGWNQEGDHVLFYEPHGTTFHLLSLPVNGQEGQDMKLSNRLVTSPSLSRDRSFIAYVEQSANEPPEVYMTDLNRSAPIQITHLNESSRSNPKTQTDVITWKSTDGETIEGLLTYPIGYQKGKQYPLLLVIHGGPMSFFQQSYLGNRYPYPLAAFAQEGFMILRPNPRGSCGYGAEFRCANYHDWGGKDYEDIMAGIDDLIGQDLVDANRLGVMGWSYGGYMTAWMITKTPRFRAASMGAGVTNLLSISGTMDLERFIPDYFGPFSKNRNLYEERSPIYHVTNITTPCLIQHGTYDTRVPVSQSYEFYRALKQEGKETELVLYPGMSHHISDPKMSKDVMDRNLAWFKKHLQD